MSPAHTPSSNAQQNTCSAKDCAETFERYLDTLKASMQHSQLQMSSAVVAMERCRNAIEWHNAVQLQHTVLSQNVQQNLAQLINWKEKLLANQPQQSQIEAWQALMRPALQVLQAVSTMAPRGQDCRTQLLVLSDAIMKLEQMSSDLAHCNDIVSERAASLAHALAASTAPSNPHLGPSSS